MKPGDKVFHEGELLVQERAGEQLTAVRNAAVMADAVMPGARPFLAQQRMVVVASADERGDPWASMLFGQRGFVRGDQGKVVTIDRAQAVAQPSDPLWSNLRPGAALGLLAIELGSRRRLRINGTVCALSDSRVELEVREAYPNCPKYIQRRHLRETGETSVDEGAVTGTWLDPARRLLLAQADTMFVASQHPERGADASHRGGERGFLRALDDTTIRVPDYAGNSLFNTLGNVTVSSRAGLAVPDFERGRLLQLVGHVVLHFGLEEDPAQPTGGTGRYWDFHVSRWLELGLPGVFRWELLDASPFNPGATGARTP